MRMVSASTQQVLVARDEYPYLLRYLKRRFGKVVRAGNDFWCTGGQVRVVASLAPGGQLLFPGENPFAPEVVALKEIIEKERRYRIVKVPKVLHYCPTCLAFYVFSTAMNQHIGGGGEVHTITPHLEGSYTKYVPVLPPLEQRKGWIPREHLIKAFAKYVGPDAEKMADLRIIAYREGIPLSVQEMVQGAVKIPSIVYERYNAQMDAIKAKMVPPVRAKKSPSSLSTLTTQTLPTGKPQGFRTLLSSFLSWKVKVNGQVLAPEQMVEVALRLGLPINDGDHHTAATTHTADAGDFIKVVDDAAKDEALADKLAVLVKRDKKLASAVRRAGLDVARYKPSWKGRKSPKSIRYATEAKAEGEPVVPPRRAAAHDQPKPDTTDPEKEKRNFMEKFSLKPGDVVEQNGLIKATKTVTTPYGAWRVTIYNAVFTHRHIAPDEFPVHQTQIAQEIASNTGGTLAVAEDRKRGFKSLVVICDGRYTVRVAKKPLSLS